MYTVYQHKNKINGKIYIGITMRSPKERWGVNGCNYKTNPHFYAAIKNMGGIILNTIFYLQIYQKMKHVLKKKS